MQSLNISLHKIAPFITSPVNLEYGRNIIYQSEFVEILVLNFPSKAKTFVHDHGISVGCILIVNGTLQNITYENNSERIEEFTEGNIFTVKKGVELQNIEYVVYAHRVYHDLDIIVNKYRGETNIWGYTEFGDGKDIKVIEQAIQTK
ncbi:cysteine dioxygenase [Bacillus sp. HC-Mk]